MRKLYKCFQSLEVPWKVRYFVKTGEFRPVKAREFYLSGAIPEVYQAGNATLYPSSYYIMREASKDETHCPTCGHHRAK